MPLRARGNAVLWHSVSVLRRPTPIGSITIDVNGARALQHIMRTVGPVVAQRVQIVSSMLDTHAHTRLFAPVHWSNRLQIRQCGTRRQSSLTPDRARFTRAESRGKTHCRHPHPHHHHQRACALPVPCCLIRGFSPVVHSTDDSV